jgi:hypothetical protein
VTLKRTSLTYRILNDSGVPNSRPYTIARRTQKTASLAATIQARALNFCGCVGRNTLTLSDSEFAGLRHFALVLNDGICHHGFEPLGPEIQDDHLEQVFLSFKDTIMKLRIKLERQKIARGHGSSRAQVVQADQRTQRERDRGASKRAVLKRELDDR